MSNTEMDLRQTLGRDTLQAATGISGSLGDSIARGLNAEVTKVYYFTVTGSSRVLTVSGAGAIQNSESLVSHVNPSFVGISGPRQAAFTVTFPSTSGSNITSSLSIDSGATVTVSSNDYINVGINISPSGTLAFTYGTQNSVAASAGLPATPAGYWSLGYVQLFNNAGTIANLTNASVFHYVSQNFTQYLAVGKAINISSSTNLTDNSIHFVNTSATRTLTLPAPSANSCVIILDSTGSAGTNAITIAQHASEKINGTAASYVFNVSDGALELISNGTDWFIVASWIGLPVSTSLSQNYVPIGNASNIYTATNTSLVGDIAASTSSATVTISIATPGVVSDTAHGLSTGDKVYFTTTGALPSPLAVNTTYFVIVTGSNAYELATNLSNAAAGTAINTTGTQSGTHTRFSGGLKFRSQDARIPGKISGNNDTTGYVGEISAVNVTSASASGVTAGQFGNITSITLSPGHWVVYTTALNTRAASQNEITFAVSSDSGNTTTDHVNGYNVWTATMPTTGAGNLTLTIPPFDQSLSSTSTVYLKAKMDAGTWTQSNFWGSIRAYRVS